MKTLNPLLFSLFFIILLGCEYAEDDSPSITGNSNGLQYYLTDGSGYIPDAVEGEQYNDFVENPFIKVADEPISTFSIDADGGSYSNTRRFIEQGMKPPPEAIRVEEFINYFNYDYDEPTGGRPVAVNGEISTCPWNEEHHMIRIGLKGKTIPDDEMPIANFVLLVDVSGSMSSDDKLPLLKKGLINFVHEMRDEDRIAIVTYAGSAGVVLNSTPGTQKNQIINALESLGAGGSTAGAQGIITAYEIAQENFIEEGNNRVILGTDGDFNVGISSQDELIDLIEKKRDSGIFLSVIGYGTGNLREGQMEQIANHGNGNFEYIDNIQQSDKVFIHEYSKFLTVVKDVKVQVEFNAAMVTEYRLIGYENRLLENEDFEDDTKDAGEIGSGQAITALYEIIPVQGSSALRFDPVFTIDFRYKNPEEDISKEITLTIPNNYKDFAMASENMRFCASAAGFGLLLRDSQYKGDITYDKIHQWASAAIGNDPYGFKADFLDLVIKAKNLP